MSRHKLLKSLQNAAHARTNAQRIVSNVRQLNALGDDAVYAFQTITAAVEKRSDDLEMFDAPVFHNSSNEPLTAIIEAGEQLYAAGGKTALKLAVEACHGHEHELSLAFAGIGGYAPLAKYRNKKWLKGQ